MRATYLFTFVTLLILVTSPLKAEIKGSFDPIENNSDRSVKQIAETSFDLFQSTTNELLETTPDVTVRFGYEDGPLYNPNENQIHIPYDFITEVQHRFDKAKYQQSGVSIDEASQDALLHTLFHELAHALINIYELPVVGKEEDAADSLATFLLIELFEDGQEIAISAADLFDLESTDRDVLDDEDFWGEHSLDEQRFFATLCHVYGSAPDQYDSLIEVGYLSEDHKERCIEEYEQLTFSWTQLLDPYLKNTD